MLDSPKRPKGLQRRLVRKRSNASSQASSSQGMRREARQPLPPEHRPQASKRIGPESRAQVRRQPHAQPNSAMDGRTASRLTSNLRESSSHLPGSNPTSRSRDLANPGSNNPARRLRPGEMRQNRLDSTPKRRLGVGQLFSRSTPSEQQKQQRQSHSLRSSQPKPGKTRQPQARTAPLVYLVRLLILGIGVGAIVGTVISIWNPGLRSPATDQAASSAAKPAQNALSAPSQPAVMQANVASVRIGREMTDVVAKVTPLTRNLTDLVPGAFVIDVDNGDYFSFNGNATFSSASMIKLPILIAFFQDVDAGKVKLDEMLILQQADVAEGSGDMQYAGVGSQYSALETATNMIITSDNTATNMIIRRLGGIQVLNQRFRQWGLQQTLLRNLLPDLEGSNTTSPKELSSLMILLNDGKLITMKSRDRAFDIMRRTVTDTLLPSVLSPGSTIAHKTGDIGSMVGDVGVVDLPSGRRYAITTMVKRPHNDPRAQDLIRQIAAVVYEHFGGQPVLPPSPTPTPMPGGVQPAMPTLQNPTQVPGVTQPGTVPPNTMAPAGTVPNAAPTAPTIPAPDPAAPAPGEPVPEAASPAPAEPEANSEPEATDPENPDAASAEDGQSSQDDSTL